jgi:hypothetical protein
MDDAARLRALWVGEQGGQGTVLKDRRAPHRPGVRQPRNVEDMKVRATGSVS